MAVCPHSPGMASTRSATVPSCSNAIGGQEPSAGGDVVRMAVQHLAEAAEVPLVLAVSGGRDSMALLYAMARWAPQAVACVATFDHGTGAYATEAAALVVAEARRLGLFVTRERARARASSEDGWRRARWEFLRRVARAHSAQVVTAHTRDDQVETVVMRALRGAGARGLAGLAAPSCIGRPFLTVGRRDVGAWVAAERIPFLEDPANADRRFLRVRVRHEVLPALEAAAPGFMASMLDLAEQAAAWRRDVDAYLRDVVPLSVAAGGGLLVPATPFEATTEAGQGVLWPACIARLGVPLDRRGTRELIRFTKSRKRGALVRVAGGVEVMRVAARSGHGDAFVVRRVTMDQDATWTWTWTGDARALPSRLGDWSFTPVVAPADTSDPALIWVPMGETVTVRPWQPGDRIATRAHPAGRRLARYLSEYGIPAPDRRGWPVVVVRGELVGVPAVCRREAAPSRPGGLDLLWYRCDRSDRERR